MRIAIAEIISSLKKIEEGAKGTIIGELVNGAVNKAERMESACTAGYDTCAIPEGWVKEYSIKDPVPWWIRKSNWVYCGAILLLVITYFVSLRLGIIEIVALPPTLADLLIALAFFAVLFVSPVIIDSQKFRIQNKHGVVWVHYKFLKKPLSPIIEHDIQTIKEEGIFEEIYIVGPKAFFKTGHGIAVIIGEAGDQPFLIREISL